MSAAPQLLEMPEVDAGAERREYRRHDLSSLDIDIDRLSPDKRSDSHIGKILDLSAGGVKFLSTETSIRPDQQIRVSIQLPDYAGICPFVRQGADHLEPSCCWVGWMLVTRVRPVDEEHVEIAGRLVDMNECNRGMLGLYLSAQPLAA